MFYKTVETAYDLKEEFKNYGRDYYSLEACEVMIEESDELNPEGEPLDIIALCGYYTEYTEAELKQEHPNFYEEYEEEKKEDEDLTIEEYFSEYTRITELENGKFLMVVDF